MSFDWIAGVFGSAAVQSVLRRLRFTTRRSVRIIHPPHGHVVEIPADRDEDTGFMYVVRGTLSGRLDNEELWLLTQDVANNRVWPQSQNLVSVDTTSGEWSGGIRLYPGTTGLRVLAVIAPPTAQQLCRYYFEVGPKTDYAPLSAVPADCAVRDEVQISVPKEPRSAFWQPITAQTQLRESYG
jgi:hypothetical protein